MQSNMTTNSNQHYSERLATNIWNEWDIVLAETANAIVSVPEGLNVCRNRKSHNFSPARDEMFVAYFLSIASLTGRGPLTCWMLQTSCP